MSTQTDPDIGEIAGRVLSETTRELGLRSHDLPQAVRDATEDYHVAIGDTLDAAGQLASDLAELHAKRDLIPGPGLLRLRGEALQGAQERADDAERRSERALEGIKSALADAALPRLDPAREQLARQELSVAIGEPRGGAVGSRVIEVVNKGSREVIATLFTPFGQTLLASRGLVGRDLEDVLTSARTIIAHSAVERGETAREILAGKALKGIGGLGAARGAAGSHFRHVVSRG